ncbi:MAG: tryptophan-rich sensory protein [Verrucomicrobia bacterium]|nr:tryptophan-rich sensory protein [Verrucomicrobiota bacterium]
MRHRNFGVLLIFIVLCLAVELIASRLTLPDVIAWYPTLLKPRWNPPNQIFGPVWTALYLMMAFALWLFWQASTTQSKKAGYFCFGFQLFFNLIWSFLFFVCHSPFWALMDIFLLWVSIFGTLAVFYKTRPLAGYLLIPYLLWVTFAALLNFKIWTLNS